MTIFVSKDRGKPACLPDSLVYKLNILWHHARLEPLELIGGDVHRA